MSARNRRAAQVPDPSRNKTSSTGQVPDLPQKMKRLAISAFILFHLAGIVSFSMPVNAMLLPSIKDAVRPYFLWSGLFQSWDMFAPEPRMTNIRVHAGITFRDGRTRIWQFPAMEDLGYADRYAKERYRKFAHDNLRLDENSALWPDAARYIARLNNANPGNPPVSIQLVREWSDIALWGNGPEPWTSYVFYRYAVTPGDLR